MTEWIELILRGGNIGFLAAAIVLLWKVKAYLDRDESLRKDYPPHRHVNGSRIIYPTDYQPSPIERLSEGGD